MTKLVLICYNILCTILYCINVYILVIWINLLSYKAFIGSSRMRKFLKNSILEIFQTMYEAHVSIKKMIDKKDFENVSVLLEDCQNTAVQIGTSIESSEGEGFVTVGYLEEYCEAVYEVATSISDDYSGNKAQKALDKKLIKAENSVKNDVKVRLEIVFCPYKASMWDSLESVWKAADEDPDCDAYVVPIPYYDRNPDYSFGEFHYEGGDYPNYVPITHYEAYDFEARRPDVVYIHNPYDEYNNVTSVDPRFYSHELKKYTECLVYIPYYSTTGGMSEGQYKLSAYYHADYIIMQAPKFHNFFDATLPYEKLLPLGSPKFDKIINICNNPPEPPAEWKAKMAGKKVYFYNTSLGGMLSNTKMFLHKMQYVFETFANRDKDDSCLLWRPHPLFESTIDSMRPQFKEWFAELKKFYLENDIGIYDTTPDITTTIAQCDAYIGDSGTSVTSLFGIAGKPLFILNNAITAPADDDDIIAEQLSRGFRNNTDTQWYINRKNELYYSQNNDFNYKFVCRLNEYASGDYYLFCITIDGTTYACPNSAQDILIVDKNGVKGRIKLDIKTERSGAFYHALQYDKYIFLIPFNYPCIVRFDTQTGHIKYINTERDVFVTMVNGEYLPGGCCIHNGHLYLGSPYDNRILDIDCESCTHILHHTKVSDNYGCMTLASDGTNIWISSFREKCIIKWNPDSNNIVEYTQFPQDIMCEHPLLNYDCLERPFSYPIIAGDYLYYPAAWANMCVKVNITTGEISKWDIPIDILPDYKNGYYLSYGKYGIFNVNGQNMLFSCFDRKLYKCNINENTMTELCVKFNADEIKTHNPGFEHNSEWMKYCCDENSCVSLSDFLNGKISGKPFDKNKQILYFNQIAANNDGTCGIKTHNYIKHKVLD